MGDKGKRDKGKREKQKKGKQTPKEKRKQKKGTWWIDGLILKSDIKDSWYYLK